MAQVKKTEEYGGLRQLMVERGLSHADVARMAGLGNTAVWRVLNGTYVFWARSERKVEKALGVRPGALRGPADKVWLEEARVHLAHAIALLKRMDAKDHDHKRRGK
jgi:transcriptional regulator with XRE-family HTH domain